MQAWHTRTAHCLHEEEGLAKHVHLGGCLSGVCVPALFEKQSQTAQILTISFFTLHKGSGPLSNTHKI